MDKIKNLNSQLFQNYQELSLEDNGVVLTKGTSGLSGYLMLDYDDTLVNTTLGEKVMCQAILKFIGKHTDGKYGEEILKLSFDLANEQKDVIGKKIYNPKKEIHSLYVLVNGLKNNKSWEETKSELLAIVREDKLGKFEDLNNDPMLTDAKLATEKIFDSPDFEKMAEIIRILMTKSKDMGVGMGIFTFGDPVFQAEKVGRYTKRHNFEFDEIWFSKMAKGDFLKYLKGKNYLQEDHFVLLADDNPSEIESVIQNSKPGKGIFSVVRIINKDTKYSFTEYSKSFNKSAGLIDFTQANLEIKDALKVLTESVPFLSTSICRP